jgi:ATP-dependent Clp protease ATP-binding subunit ClpA
MLLGAGSGPSTLQAHVSKAINSAARRSGVRCMRVTRMMFERFTEKAIKVVMLAQEEARRLGHNFVGTEQILLGLIGESTGKLTPASCTNQRLVHFSIGR